MPVVFQLPPYAAGRPSPSKKGTIDIEMIRECLRDPEERDESGALAYGSQLHGC